jgi:pyruvate ferredoxin oxidoreductase delta subunit
MDEYAWHELEVGCVITEPGNAKIYKTGDWKSLKPVVEEERCIKCGVCWLYCPDVAIEKTPEGYFQANLDYCKGCGICATECWTGCITMVEEQK